MKKHWAPVLAASGIAILPCLPLLSPPAGQTASYSTRGHETQTTDQRTASHATSSVDATKSPILKEDIFEIRAANEDESEFLPPIFAHKIKISDSLLIFSTIILAFVTYLLYRATERIVKNSDKNFEWQLRAYISATPSILIDFGEGRKTQVIVEVRNDGLTPAHNFSFFASIERLSDDLADGNAPLGEIRRGEVRPNVTLHPRAERQIFADVFNPLTKEDVDQICDGLGNKFYVYGTIYYDDVFGEGRVTNFCASAHPQAIKEAVEVAVGEIAKRTGLRSVPRIGQVTVPARGLWLPAHRHNNAT